MSHDSFSREGPGNRFLKKLHRQPDGLASLHSKESPVEGIVSETLSQQLMRYIQKLEALEEEKAEISASIREALQEAKAEGVDVRALKELLKIRKQENHDIEEQQSTLRQYLQALGMSRN